MLWKSVGRGRITETEAVTSVTNARLLGLLGLPTAEVLPQALTFGRSVYDSIYIAAAMTERLQLLTADERLVNATGARLPVEWLGASPGLL